MRRIYDGNVLVDWDVPPDAAACPPDETARRKWGWQQDEQGRWYRLWAPGQRLQQVQSAADVHPAQIRLSGWWQQARQVNHPVRRTLSRKGTRRAVSLEVAPPILACRRMTMTLLG